MLCCVVLDRRISCRRHLSTDADLFRLMCVDSCTAHSSDLDSKPLWLVLHSQAINANQAVGCSRFDVIIEIPVVLLLSLGSQPPALSPLLTPSTPLHLDHPNIDPHQVRFHQLLPSIGWMLRKWSMTPKFTRWSSVACCVRHFSSNASVSSGLFCKEVALNREIYKIFIFDSANITSV